MQHVFDILAKISPLDIEYDRAFLNIDNRDETHAVRIALAASSSEPYILLERDGFGVSFEAESSLISWYANLDFIPIKADSDDLKIYMDRFCASVRSGGYNSDTLRKFFNRIEFYCYIICKYRIFNGDRFYKPDSDTQNDRIKLLVSHNVISTHDRSVLRELATVRNTFAHTLIDIGRLSFRNAPLKDVLNRSHLELHEIISKTMTKLITQYDTYAVEQVEWEEFVSIFGAIVGHIDSIKHTPA